MFEKGKPITIHEHTFKSDGSISFEALLKYANKNNYALVGPADHDYIELKRLQTIFGLGPKDMKNAYIDLDLSKMDPNLDGQTIKYITCCEFTARDDKVLNIKGNHAKYHFLVVAPRLDTYNEFLELLLLKRQNDIDYDLATIEYLFRYSDVKFPAKELNDFRTNFGLDISYFSKELALVFFDNSPHLIKQVAKSRSMLKKLINHVPTVKRLNVPVKILFDAVHSCGGLVLMAHPARNLRRVDDIELAVENFIDLGIDGFNIKEMEDKHINDIIKRKCQESTSENKLILDAGGEDCHTLNDYKFAQHTTFTTNTSKVFLEELQKLQAAREQNLATHRTYKDIDYEALKKFIETAKTTFRGLDYYQSFKENADKIYAIEELKMKLREGKVSYTKDSYDTQFVLNNMADYQFSPAARKYLKKNDVVKLHDVYDILQGTFVVPEPEPSKRGRHDNMVSKEASRYYKKGQNNNKNTGISK